MLHASTSPFYPLFAALDVNAKIHSGDSGRRMWMDCVKLGIETRKSLLARCSMLRPFIPPVVGGKNWQDYATDVIANDARFFNFVPDERWHGFEGYNQDQYLVDPCKLLLTTPGIDASTGRYTSFGIPAAIWRLSCVKMELCQKNVILTRSYSC